MVRSEEQRRGSFYTSLKGKDDEKPADDGEKDKEKDKEGKEETLQWFQEVKK